MGIKDFSATFNHTRIITWKDYANKKVAVDAMYEIHRAALGAKSVKALTDAEGNPTIHINVILANLLEMRRHNVESIWCFDHDQTGDTYHNPAKLNEVLERRKKKAVALKKLQVAKDELDKAPAVFSDDEDEKETPQSVVLDVARDVVREVAHDVARDVAVANIASLEKQTFTISRAMIDDVKLMLGLLGVSHCDAPASYEGEQIAAALSAAGKVHAVYSADTDPIPFGAHVLLRRNPRDKKIYEYTQIDILNQITAATPDDQTEKIDLAYLRKVCAVLGSDFSKRSRGVGPKTIFKKMPSIELAEDQRGAVAAFSKAVNLDDVQVFKATPYTDAAVSAVIDWLSAEKGFNADRLRGMFEKSLPRPAKTAAVVKKAPAKTTTPKKAAAKTSTKKTK